MSYNLDYSINIDKIGNKPKYIYIEASKTDACDLANLFGVIELGDIKANVDIKRNKNTLTVKGSISCYVIQECVISLEPVKNNIEENFEVHFDLNEKIYTDDNILSPNIIEQLKGDKLNIGKIITEQISLAIPDFPKKENAKFTSYIEAPEAVEKIESKTHKPFAKLLGEFSSDDKFKPDK